MSNPYRELPIDERSRLASLAALEVRRRKAVETLADFGNFVRAAWPIIDPSPLRWNWHHDYLCEWLTLVARRLVRRLIINIPPRSSKSTIVNICFPAYCWTIDPTMRFVTVSYEGSLSTDFSVRRRALFNSEFFQHTWPGRVLFSSDQNQKTQYRNVLQGEMLATSVGGAVTGRGGNLIIDDPLNPKMAFSDVERESVNRDYDSTLRSRLNDPKQDFILVIMQRTHEADLTGHLLKREPGEWQHVSIPMVAEKDEQVTFPLSGRTIERKKGEPLQAERWDADWCTKEAAGAGSYNWASQYQQRPATLEGGIIKFADIRYYTRDPERAKKDGIRLLPEEFDIACQSWDCAFKDTKDSAFVSGQAWARFALDFYLLGRIHDKMDLPRTISGVRALTARFPWIVMKLIEDKANGPAVLQSLREEIDGLTPFSPDKFGDKVARVFAVSPIYENHHVFLPLPDEEPWVTDVVHEWCTFPNSAYKDDTDAMSQALLKLRQATYGLIGYLEAVQAAGGVEKYLAQEAEKMKDAPWTDAAAKIEGARTLGKIAVGEETKECPCGSKMIQKINWGWRCAQCGMQFDRTGNEVTPPPTRGEILKGIR